MYNKTIIRLGTCKGVVALDLDNNLPETQNAVLMRGTIKQLLWLTY